MSEEKGKILSMDSFIESKQKRKEAVIEQAFETGTKSKVEIDGKEGVYNYQTGQFEKPVKAKIKRKK